MLKNTFRNSIDKIEIANCLNYFLNVILLVAIINIAIHAIVQPDGPMWVEKYECKTSGSGEFGQIKGTSIRALKKRCALVAYLPDKNHKLFKRSLKYYS